MQSTPPKLIYKSLERHKPTSFPAFFYGMPDNHVYVVYSKPYKTPSGRGKNEFIVGLLKEFSYDYKEELLFERRQGELKPLFLESFVDKYDPKLKIVKKSKKIKNIFTSDVLVESFLNNCIKQVSPEPVLSY